MTNTSRRAFLTGAAPVAAALVLAGGTAAVDAAVAPAITSAAPAAVDPIFALIERHLAAIDEEERTAEIFGQQDEMEDHDNRGVVVGEGPIVVFIPKMIPDYAQRTWAKRSAPPGSRTRQTNCDGISGPTPSATKTRLVISLMRPGMRLAKSSIA
jgi:hypothetical protein